MSKLIILKFEYKLVEEVLIIMDQANARRPSENQNASSKKRSLKSPKRIGSLILIVILLGLLGGSIYMRSQMNQKLTYADSVKKNQYQAVFLTNGQVYFGKINSTGQEYLNLGSVFYLQVQQSVQPSTDNKATASDPAKTQNLSLAKLGGELHGPEDNMYISQKQVLFWENLKDDSQVVKAIKATPTK